MRRSWGVVGVVLVLGITATAGAQPGKGRGHGQPESTEGHVERAGKRVVNEAADAVADELTGTPGSTSPGGMPPGLAKQGKMPPGLEKQGKTPPGWSHGRKAGWDKTPGPKRESFIRRIIGSIFRKAKQPEPSTPSKE